MIKRGKYFSLLRACWQHWLVFNFWEDMRKSYEKLSLSLLIQALNFLHAWFFFFFFPSRKRPSDGMRSINKMWQDLLAYWYIPAILNLGMPFKKAKMAVKTRRHCKQKVSSGNTVQDLVKRPLNSRWEEWQVSEGNSHQIWWTTQVTFLKSYKMIGKNVAILYS